MRRNVSIALAVLIVLSRAAFAQEESPLRSISVSGTVETKTAPDQIMWRISLTDMDKNMRVAKKSNDEKVKAVIALRKELGVGDGDMETGIVSIHQEYERDARGNQGEFKYFLVRRGITIRQRDLKRFDDFFDALVASAEMNVSFNYASSRIHEIRAETRLKAATMAKDKAEAMCKAVGAKLGKVISISETPPRDSRGQSLGTNMFSNSSVALSTPSVDLATESFVPGAMSVRMTVYATFEIE